MVSANVAAPCPPSSYAPQYNRLAKCLKCQSGLAESPTSGLLDGQRDSKRAVCKLPPGKFMSQGLVRLCPQGFYRENYVPFDAAIGTICLPCNPGITTANAGARLASECNNVLPGYGIDEVLNVTGPASLPALPQAFAGGLPTATLCDFGFYSSGGYCAQCPSGTVTRVKGAQSIEECVVPPGYVLKSGAMGQCQSGGFREGWVMFSDPKATACTPCGDNIDSEPRDLDESPRATAGSLVRATSACCFIEAGQGMIAQGKNLFVAKDCPINTYGAAGKVYGWAAAPCKPCPRNMITDGATMVNNSDVCINDDGFGYASEGASRCMPGFYSAKGSKRTCQQCSPGRTTEDAPLKQRFITDCFVKPGYGVVDSTSNSTDAFNINTSGLNSSAAVALPVLECPLGHWGAGNTLGATCQPCPAGSTTQDTGATSAADCNVCLAGFGQLALSTGNSSSCTACAYGSFQPGGLASCTACPSTTFYAPVDGAGESWTAQGTTLFTGAAGIEMCVPMQSQLSPDAGQAYFSPEAAAALTTAVPAPSLDACLATCPAGRGCLVQFDVQGGVCRFAALAWDPQPSSAPGVKLLYKLPPSTMGSASSVTAGPSGDAAEGRRTRAKTIASGLYARMAVADAAAWAVAGVPLDAALAQTFKWGKAPEWDGPGRTEDSCQKKCDDSVICWGFLWDSATSSCSYRGGEDRLHTRSFFALPSMDAVNQAPVLEEPSPSPEAPSLSPLVVPSPSPVTMPSPSLLAPSPSPVTVASPSPLAVPSPSPVIVPSPSPRPIAGGGQASPSPAPASTFYSGPAASYNSTLNCLDVAGLLALEPAASVSCLSSNCMVHTAPGSLTPGDTHGQNPGYFCPCGGQLLLSLPCPASGHLTLTYGSSPKNQAVAEAFVWPSLESSLAAVQANAAMSCAAQPGCTLAHATAGSYSGVQVTLSCAPGSYISLHAQEYSVMCLASVA